MARELDECDNTLTTGDEAKARWHDIGTREKAKADSAREGEVVEVDGVVALASEAKQDDEFMVMDSCPDEYDLGR